MASKVPLTVVHKVPLGAAAASASMYAGLQGTTWRGGSKCFKVCWYARYHLPRRQQVLQGMLVCKVLMGAAAASASRYAGAQGTAGRGGSKRYKVCS